MDNPSAVVAKQDRYSKTLAMLASFSVALYVFWFSLLWLLEAWLSSVLLFFVFFGSGIIASISVFITAPLFKRILKTGTIAKFIVLALVVAAIFHSIYFIIRTF